MNLNQKDNFIGDSRNESIIIAIFDSITNFAKQIELFGNEFVYQDSVKIVYNQTANVYGFFFV